MIKSQYLKAFKYSGDNSYLDSVKDKIVTWNGNKATLVRKLRHNKLLFVIETENGTEESYEYNFHGVLLGSTYNDDFTQLYVDTSTKKWANVSMKRPGKLSLSALFDSEDEAIVNRLPEEFDTILIRFPLEISI